MDFKLERTAVQSRCSVGRLAGVGRWDRRDGQSCLSEWVSVSVTSLGTDRNVCATWRPSRRMMEVWVDQVVQ